LSDAATRGLMSAKDLKVVSSCRAALWHGKLLFSKSMDFSGSDWLCPTNRSLVARLFSVEWQAAAALRLSL